MIDYEKNITTYLGEVWTMNMLELKYSEEYYYEVYLNGIWVSSFYRKDNALEYIEEIKEMNKNTKFSITEFL